MILLQEYLVRRVSFKKEEYLSYENWMKINESSELLKYAFNDHTESTVTGTWVLVGDAITDDDRKMIDHYIESLILGN